MKKIILTALLSSLITMMFMPSNNASASQSVAPRSDLVTALRQDSAALFTTIQTFRGHRAEYVSKNISFVSGDLVGANVTGTFVATDVNQMVTDMKTICDAIENGGTISVGVWANVLKIK